MELPQYSRLLAFKTDLALKKLGLTRDEIGQIRDEKNLLICGYSGRSHRHFLLPRSWMNPATGKNDCHWLDRQEIKESYKDNLDEIEAKAGKELRRFVSRKLGVKASIISRLGKIFF